MLYRGDVEVGCWPQAVDENVDENVDESSVSSMRSACWRWRDQLAWSKRVECTRTFDEQYTERLAMTRRGSCALVVAFFVMSAPPTAAAPRYFSFKDFLSEADAAAFFHLAHAEQVAKVTQYLDFLGQQPDAAQFTTSSKASVSFARLRDGDSDDEAEHEPDAALLQQLVEGRTRSGFGAFGTEPGFLPQKRLSLAVAHAVEEIGHTYIVERNKRGIAKPLVLNSRSFFFYWCHAEKQKLMDIREKFNATEESLHSRRHYWHRIVIVVDRAMCEDCIRFAECFARSERAFIHIQDPDVVRVFPPSNTQQVRCIPTSVFDVETQTQ